MQVLSMCRMQEKLELNSETVQQKFLLTFFELKRYYTKVKLISEIALKLILSNASTYSEHFLLEKCTYFFKFEFKNCISRLILKNNVALVCYTKIKGYV